MYAARLQRSGRAGTDVEAIEFRGPPARKVAHDDRWAMDREPRSCPFRPLPAFMLRFPLAALVGIVERWRRGADLLRSLGDGLSAHIRRADEVKIPHPRTGGQFQETARAAHVGLVGVAVGIHVKARASCGVNC